MRPAMWSPSQGARKMLRVCRSCKWWTGGSHDSYCGEPIQGTQRGTCTRFPHHEYTHEKHSCGEYKRG